MCGRYTLVTDLTLLAEHFAFAADEMCERAIPPRYNVAPSQDAPVVISFSAGGEGAAAGKAPGDEAAVIIGADKRMVMMRWGLVPRWAKEEKIGDRMINARAETVAEKPSFKNALKTRRCLIPADGFYEWAAAEGGGRKQPMRFTMADGAPFAMAGLWEAWQRPEGGELFSFTIITTEANAALKPYHHRMPVILNPADYEKWLDPMITDADAILPLLAQYPAEKMRAYRVSTAVNSPKNNTPECIEEA